MGPQLPCDRARSTPAPTSSDAYLLIAHNDPSGVTVHRIDPDGIIGGEVKHTTAPDVGIFAHQVRVTPSNSAAILLTRGNDPADGKPEGPGALKIFGFKDGQLTNRASIARPGGGYGFGPRRLDFHPTRPWVYVSLERHNKLHVYELRNDSLNPAGAVQQGHVGANVRPQQIAGTVHVHPNGRYVYVANRSDSMTEFHSKQVYLGGENNITVFTIAPDTGEPMLVQNADTHGFHQRTFALDPSGRMLVAANLTARLVRGGDQVRTQPALVFARAYNVETGGNTQFWSGMVTLSQCARIAISAIRPSFCGDGLRARSEIGAEILGSRPGLIGRKWRAQEDHPRNSPLPFAL